MARYDNLNGIHRIRGNHGAIELLRCASDPQILRIDRLRAVRPTFPAKIGKPPVLASLSGHFALESRYQRGLCVPHTTASPGSGGRRAANLPTETGFRKTPPA
jgi:hypothetical protein